MSYKFLLFFLLLICGRCFGQTGSLNVGDQVPYNPVDYVVKMDGTEKGKLTWEGKLTILDFWSVWCSACILALPKLDSLQHLYGDELQIISVTKNNHIEVGKALDRAKMRIENLGIIYEDSVLNRWFPHVSEPFHVWINKEGKVQYVTGTHNATAEHIARALKGESLNLSRSRVDGSFKLGSLMQVAPQHKIEENLVGYSAFFKGLHERTRKNGILMKADRVKDRTLLNIYNRSLYVHYLFAYSLDIYGFVHDPMVDVPHPLIEIESKDSASFFFPSDGNLVDAWRNTYLMSYESVQAGCDTFSLLKKLQSDLAANLPYQVQLEKRWVKALVIRDSNVVISRYNTSGKVYPAKKRDAKSYEVRNMSLKNSFVRDLMLSKMRFNIPVIDRVQYTAPVDIKMNVSPTASLEELQRALPAYGLHINEEMIEVPVLVIKDRCV